MRRRWCCVIASRHKSDEAAVLWAVAEAPGLHSHLHAGVVCS